MTLKECGPATRLRSEVQQEQQASRPAPQEPGKGAAFTSRLSEPGVTRERFPPCRPTPTPPGIDSAPGHASPLENRGRRGGGHRGHVHGDVRKNFVSRSMSRSA